MNGILLLLALLAAVISLGWCLVEDIAGLFGATLKAPVWAHLGSLLAMIWFVGYIIRALWLRKI